MLKRGGSQANWEKAVTCIPPQRQMLSGLHWTRIVLNSIPKCVGVSCATLQGSPLPQGYGLPNVPGLKATRPEAEQLSWCRGPSLLTAHMAILTRPLVLLPSEHASGEPCLDSTAL